MGQFGDKFRKERERKGISLEDVSNVTKISSRMLQAIEQEQFDLLPGGVFNRGFIRAYAKHLGLNDEEAVTDYLACLRQAQIDAQANWQPEERSVQRGPYLKPALKKQPPVAEAEELPELHLPRAEDVRPPRRDYVEKRGGVPWTLLAAAAVVVVLGAALWFRQSGRHAQSGAQAASAAATSPTPAAQNAPAATPIAPTATQPSPSRSNSNAKSMPRLLASSSPEEPAAKAPETTHRASPAPSPPSSPGSNTAANEAAMRTIPAENAGTLPASSTPSAKAAPSNAASSNVSAADARPLTLVIRASETSWISIIADGQPVSHETLIAPAHASVRASREIIARIGNAAGVSFLWNGQEIPAQGAEAEVKTFVFDAQGMREVPNQPPVSNQPVPNQ